MAGNVQPASSVQEIVNAVTNNLSNLPRQENAVQTAASNADTRNEVSVTSELNRAFRIPRASTSSTVQAICRRQWHLSGLLRITFQRLQITEGP